MLNFLLLVAVLLLFCGTVVANEEYEVDANGNVIDSSSSSGSNSNSAGQLSVRVFNDFENDLSLWWSAPGNDVSDDVFMFDMPTREPEGIGMNTFAGHRFYVTEKGGDGEKLGEIFIRGGLGTYRFSPSMAAPSMSSSTGGPRQEAVATTSVGKTRKVADGSPIKPIGQRTTAMSAKFRCLTSYEVDYYYDDGEDGTFQGTLSLGKETTINTYETHVFYFTRKGRKNKEVIRFEMNADQILVRLTPRAPSLLFLRHAISSISSQYVIQDPKKPPPEKYLTQLRNEEAFMEGYLNRTGILWRHYYGPEGPRGPPGLYMWPADEVGELHKVTSYEGLWHCDGERDVCQSKDSVDMELEVISIAPRAFYIPRCVLWPDEVRPGRAWASGHVSSTHIHARPSFLSDFEADHIIALAKDQVKMSEVGDNEGGGARFRCVHRNRGRFRPSTCLCLPLLTLLHRVVSWRQRHADVAQRLGGPKDVRALRKPVHPCRRPPARGREAHALARERRGHAGGWLSRLETTAPTHIQAPPTRWLRTCRWCITSTGRYVRQPSWRAQNRAVHSP